MPIPILASHPAAPLPSGPVLPPREAARPPAPPRLTLALISAVAGIVAIAAQRSAAVGEFEALRDALERALDTAAPVSVDPREAGAPDVPPLADADRAAEADRLLALALRQHLSR